MVKYFDYLRNRLDASIWFIPVCISITSFVLGLLMLWLKRHILYLSASLQTLAMPVESARQVLSVSMANSEFLRLRLVFLNLVIPGTRSNISPHEDSGLTRHTFANYAGQAPGPGWREGYNRRERPHQTSTADCTSLYQKTAQTDYIRQIPLRFSGSIHASEAHPKSRHSA